MPREHPGRRGVALLPDGDATVLAAAGKTPAVERGHGVDGALVKSQHLLRGAGTERPDDGGRIKAARDKLRAVLGEGQRAAGTTVAAQLSLGRQGCGKKQNEKDERTCARCQHWGDHRCDGASRGRLGPLRERSQAPPVADHGAQRTCPAALTSKPPSSLACAAKRASRRNVTRRCQGGRK